MALINCSNCGGYVSDKAEKCPSCGAPVIVKSVDAETSPQPEQEIDKSVTTPATHSLVQPQSGITQPVATSAARTLSQPQPVIYGGTTKKTKPSAVLGMLIGMALLAFGVYVMFGWKKPYTSGSSARSTSFGGDFYTYEHEATVAAANNVYALEKRYVDYIKDQYTFTGIFFIFTGAITTVYFSGKSKKEI